MFEKNKGNTHFYFCFAAGIYMAYIIYRMVDQLEGALEGKHWALAIILGGISLAMIGFGGYHLFFKKPEQSEEPKKSLQESEES